jgi:hypothetical protein
MLEFDPPERFWKGRKSAPEEKVPNGAIFYAVFGPAISERSRCRNDDFRTAAKKFRIISDQLCYLAVMAADHREWKFLHLCD